MVYLISPDTFFDFFDAIGRVNIDFDAVCKSDEYRECLAVSKATLEASTQDAQQAWSKRRRESPAEADNLKVRT
jgi:hypothetical protein